MTSRDSIKFPDFLDEDADSVARRLLGCVLRRELDGQILEARIVETESYDQDDEASHAYAGKTARNEVMFGPAGHLYVYFTYGMHYCCNIVAGTDGYGAGALIRAVEPMQGVDVMASRRNASGRNLTNGPAKVCQALSIDFNLRGHDLRLPPLQLIEAALSSGEQVAVSPRIGISKAKNVDRRYFIKNNIYVSQISGRKSP